VIANPLMHPALDPLRARWLGLEPRERVMVTVTVTCLALFIVYTAIIAPMTKSLTRLRTAVPEDQAKLATMRTQTAQIVMLKARGASLSARSGSILATVEQTATQRGLRGAITRMEPEGSSAVHLQLDAVPFNALIAWLAELQQTHGVRAQSANFDADPAPGMVRARLYLRGPRG
jgi:general secretion pathway protein M